MTDSLLDRQTGVLLGTRNCCQDAQPDTAQVRVTDFIPTQPIADAEVARSILENLDHTARRWDTPAGDGTMAWRGWGSDGPSVLLMHGGAGSWRHWTRNIGVLSRDHTVVAPDLPALGDSAGLPEPLDAHVMAATVLRGLKEVVHPDAPVHVAAFSFGGVIAGPVAAALGNRVQSLTLIGTGGLGPPNRSIELVRVRDKTGGERETAHRENLLRMMLGAPENVDALAVEIQEQNTSRARLNSGFMWRSTALADALPSIHGHVHAFWGEREMPDRSLLDARIAVMRKARPDAEIEVIPHVGHWACYEAADHMNAQLLRIISRV
jgi:pimeloyl-ACP methyl ester carboxylesterase